MKNLFYLNLFFLGIPIVLGLLGLFDPVLTIWALISTILTGIFQVIIGFGMYFDEPKDRLLRWYAILVLLFFASWIVSGFMENGFLFSGYLFVTPPFLALYLTFIIYKKMKQ